jgi:hypothetical protein
MVLHGMVKMECFGLFVFAGSVTKIADCQYSLLCLSDLRVGVHGAGGYNANGYDDSAASAGYGKHDKEGPSYGQHAHAASSLYGQQLHSSGPAQYQVRLSCTPH